MVKCTGKGLVVKRPGVLSKVQMLNLVLGVGVFSLLPIESGSDSKSLVISNSISTLFSTDLEAILVAISLALCDFKSLRFEIAAIPIRFFFGRPSPGVRQGAQKEAGILGIFPLFSGVLLVLVLAKPLLPTRFSNS